jgi:MFS family permease
VTLLARPPCDDGVIRGAAPGGDCADQAKPWVLAATILGSSMAFIDGSVVNVALPAVQADLATSVSGTQWVVNAYMLTLSALILVGGAAGDRLGRRRVFLLGIVVFTAASVACGLAPSAGFLIAARAAQGAGSAMLVPSSLAIISAAFTASERGRAIGTWAGFSALTTALGPVLGGWLVDAWSWRLIFFVNLPVGAATLWLSFRHVPEYRGIPGGGRLARRRAGRRRARCGGPRTHRRGNPPVDSAFGGRFADRWGPAARRLRAVRGKHRLSSCSARASSPAPTR